MHTNSASTSQTWAHDGSWSRDECTYVCMCVCMSMNVCMYICMCLCMYVSMFICIYVCIYINVCMYACTCVCMYVCINACMYACMYVSMCVYLCVYVLDTYMDMHILCYALAHRIHINMRDKKNLVAIWSTEIGIDPILSLTPLGGMPLFRCMLGRGLYVIWVS